MPPSKRGSSTTLSAHRLLSCKTTVAKYVLSWKKAMTLQRGWLEEIQGPLYQFLIQVSQLHRRK